MKLSTLFLTVPMVPVKNKLAILITLFLLFMSGCAYYNTLFNAKQSYKDGLKAVRQAADQEHLPNTAKRHFETTIEKCWKLIELYTDKSKYADDALLYIVKSEFHLGKFAQAKLHADQFMKKYPESELIPEVHLWYGKLLLQEHDIDEANKYFIRVITNAKDGRIRSQANLELGLYAFENEDYPKAIDYLQKALKEKVDDEYKARLHYYLAESYYIQKSYKEAVKRYRNVADYSPTVDIEYKTKIHLAQALSALEKYEEAEKLLRKMLTAPRFKEFVPVIKATIGEIYQKQGHVDEAMYIYREVVRARQKSPGSALAAFNLAKIYEHHLNNLDSAVTYYGEVPKLYSKFDSVEVAKSKNRFLSEFKTIRDQIRYEERLIDRLTNDSFFRDSLYTAQYEDSVRNLLGLGVDSTQNLDSLLLAHQQDTLGIPDSSKIALDSLKSDQPPVQVDSLEKEFQGFREQEKPKQESDKKEEDTKGKPKKPKRPLEKRKLPQIEFDLMNHHYHLAEFYLLKVQQYDSAAFHYQQFLNTYEDSILTPKALYSLAYIYKSPEYLDSLKVDSLEQLLLTRYPNSPFSIEIRKSRGEIKEEVEEISAEQEAYRKFLMAESLYDAGEYDRALQGYLEVARMDSTLELSAKAQFAVAWMYEHDLSQPEEALQAYQRVAEHYPKAYAYVAAAKRKITPVNYKEEQKSADSLAALVETPVDTTTAQVKPTEEVEEEFELQLEDILEDKIRWRNRRLRTGR